MKQNIPVLVVAAEAYSGSVYLGTPQPYVDLSAKQTKKLIKALQAALIEIKEHKNND